MTLDVYLAPGHGEHPDTGRVDEGARDGMATEQRDGDLICKAAELHLIDRYGATVYRQPRGGPDFRGTIGDIEHRKPRAAVEVHHDWNRAPRGGFAVGWRRDDHTRALAVALHLSYRDAGLPIRHHLAHLPGTTSLPAIVRRTTVTTVLWEADRIGAVENHRLYGRVLADGIAAHLDLQPVPSDPWETFMEQLTDDEAEVLKGFARELAREKVAGRSFAFQLLKLHRGYHGQVADFFDTLARMGSSPRGFARHGVAAIRVAREQGFTEAMDEIVAEHEGSE